MSLAAGDSIFPQRIMFQAQKLKDPREAVRDKLDEYREKYEQMEVRTVAAEMEATSLKLSVGELVQQNSQYKETIRTLTDQLNAQKRISEDSEKNLERFQRKLGRISTLLTKEVNKLRHSEKDLRLAFDSVMRCVLEFRSDAISKEDFLCAVDLIFSTTVQPSGTETARYPSTRVRTLFGDNERERLASLSRDRRKSCLAQLMAKLNDKELGAMSSEDCLSEGDWRSPSPPPVMPPQIELVKHKEPTLTSNPPMPTLNSPSNSLRRKNAVAGRGYGVNIYSLPADSDSNSSDNFEHFTPPARSQKRYHSEPQFRCLPRREDRRVSSPFPYRCSGPGYIRKTSPVLTRKPSWLVAKHRKERAPGKKGRSKSVDELLSFKVTQSMHVDSDDNSSLLDSGVYARPFEHLQSWRKVLALDGSILTGSLPRIDKAVELEESDVSGGTYLDPSEIVAAVSQTESKLGRRVSRRLRKRVDTVLHPGIYLSLVGVAPQQRQRAKSPEEIPDTKSPQKQAITPYIRMETAVSEMEGETGRAFVFPEQHSSHSDCTTDGSSADDQTHNTYVKIPLANGFDNMAYDSHTPLPPDTEDPYAMIDELMTPKSRRSGSQPVIQGMSASEPKPRSNTDPAMKLEDGYCSLEDNLDGMCISLGPAVRPPTPPPRSSRKISAEPFTTNKKLPESMTLQVPGMGPLPLYTTLRESSQRIQLIPLSNFSPNTSADEHCLSDNEHPEQLYSLGKFVAVTPQYQNQLPPAPHGKHPAGRRGTQSATTADPRWTPALLDSGDTMSSPEVKRKKGRSYLPQKGQRSHTFSTNRTNEQENAPPEKSGYLNKMDPKQKRWNRRWFVLKGSELNYYRNKDSFYSLKRPRGVINLDLWCKLSRRGTMAAFELATPNKTYHLVSANNKECEEWLRVLEAAMRLQSAAEKVTPAIKPKLPTVSGWAHVSKKDWSQKLWCTLENESLTLSSKPGEMPLHTISMRRSTIRKRRDSLLMDQKDSRSNLHSVLFTITEDSGAEVTEISPENDEDEESWYYHLSAASVPGEQGPELTNTERLLSQIQQEGGGRDHPQWKHPALNYTSAPLKNALTSLPSATLNARARRLFHSLQLFMGTAIKPLSLDYHICSVQHIIATCLQHPQLQDELYCQLLRQLSGHTSSISSNTLQGWYLLYLLIQTFLPQKSKFLWYLTTFLKYHASSPHSNVASYARECTQLIDKGSENGTRECRPSQMELQVYLSHCAHSPSSLCVMLKVPVYLVDGAVQEVEFTPLTTVQEFISQLNQEIGMPDAATAGFSLFSDWPGVEEDSCHYLFPQSKLCDIISMWIDSLEELNKVRLHQQQRSIMLFYRNRLSFKKHRGYETEKEAMFLAYQISEDIFSGRHPVARSDQGVWMAAIMAKIEYGDWNSLGGSEVEAKEALHRFCPRKFIHLALEHDQSLLQRKLVEQWKKLSDKTRHQCAHMYLHAAQQWRFCGATLFLAEKRYSSQKTNTIWLAVHEDGLSLLERNTMESLASYSYSEVSTFGSHGSDFMLVVSPRQDGSGSTGNLVEKLLLAMPQVKIREATFLIASYLRSYEGQRPNTELFSTQ